MDKLQAEVSMMERMQELSDKLCTKLQYYSPTKEPLEFNFSQSSTKTIPVVISRTVSPYSSSKTNKSSTIVKSDVSVNKLSVTSPSAVPATNSRAAVPRSAHTSTSRSYAPDLSTARTYIERSSNYCSGYNQRPIHRVDHCRQFDVTPYYRYPISSTHEYYSDSYYAPSYDQYERSSDRYVHQSSYVRYNNYPRHEYVRYEEPYQPQYRPRVHDRAPYHRYASSYNQYPPLQEYPRPNRYQPYSCRQSVERPKQFKKNQPVDRLSKQFRKNPFYDDISELMKPTRLKACGIYSQKIEFDFSLSTREFNTFSRSAQQVQQAQQVDGKLEYKNQVLVRFSLDKSNLLEDRFPLNLSLSVNQGQVSLDKFYDEDTRVQKPGPIDISYRIKTKSNKMNKLLISWIDEQKKNHDFVVGVYLARKTTSAELFNRFKILNLKDNEFAKKFVMSKLSEDTEEEIAMTDLCVSLVCPLGKLRMTTPCRGSKCTHLQCFDALKFLQMNEHKPAWHCPVCNQQIFYEDLVIDGYFDGILQSDKLKPETNEVKLHRDGSWENSIPREEFSKRVVKSKTVDVIDVDSGESSDEISVVDLVSGDEGDSVYDTSIVKLEPGVLKEEPQDYCTPDLCVFDETRPNIHYYYF